LAGWTTASRRSAGLFARICGPLCTLLRHVSVACTQTHKCAQRDLRVCGRLTDLGGTPTDCYGDPASVYISFSGGKERPAHACKVARYTVAVICEAQGRRDVGHADDRAQGRLGEDARRARRRPPTPRCCAQPGGGARCARRLACRFTGLLYCTCVRYPTDLQVS
jgi:hypothetical protein